jgi:hypothetical protein
MLLVSCVSANIGRSFPTAGLAGLEAGVTTKAQVIAQFGPPYERIDPANWRVVHFGDDETALIWRYAYDEGNLFQESSRSLQTEFNQAGLLVNYLYLSNFPVDSPTNNHAKSANFDIFAVRTKIIPRRTLEAEVVSLMGANHLTLQFNKPGVALRWYYTYSEQSRTERTIVLGQSIPKTNSKWLVIDLDAQGTVQHVEGASDFPEDVARK